MAAALFGDATAYEGKTILSEKYSKEEINDCLGRWSPYASASALEDLLGENDEFTLEILRKKSNS